VLNVGENIMTMIDRVSEHARMRYQESTSAARIHYWYRVVQWCAAQERRSEHRGFLLKDAH